MLSQRKWISGCLLTCLTLLNIANDAHAQRVQLPRGGSGAANAAVPNAAGKTPAAAAGNNANPLGGNANNPGLNGANGAANAVGGALPGNVGGGFPGGVVGGFQQNGGNIDSVVINLLIMIEQGQMGLAQFAAQQAQNPAVQQYAQAILQQQSEFLQRLQQVGTSSGAANGNSPANNNPLNAGGAAAGGNVANAASAAVGGAATPGAMRRGGGGNLTGGANAGAGGLNQQQAGTNGANGTLNNGAGNNGAGNAQGMPSAMNLMSELQGLGANFDLTYLGIQIAQQLDMIVTLNAVSQFGSGNTQQLLQQGVQMTTQQMQQGVNILRQLAGGGAGAPTGPGLNQNLQQPQNLNNINNNANGER